jgi:hypothetical protein
MVDFISVKQGWPQMSIKLIKHLLL